MSRSSWHLRVHLPIAGWIVALLALVLIHRWVPAAGWLMLHVLLLGIATNAILIWSAHFTEALLHSRTRPKIAAQLAMVNIGALAVMGGRLSGATAAVTAGAVLVAGAALLHAYTLAAGLRSALAARFGVFVRYYVMAACFLPFGAAIGAWMATGLAEPYASRAVLAHVVLNVLGWIGLTVLATSVTLVPTMLRTKLPPRGVPIARRALPLIAVAVAAAAASALLGSRAGTTLALVVVTVAVTLLLLPLAQAAHTKPPASYASWAALAALGWLVAALVTLVAGIASASSWPQAADRLSATVPPFAVGFAAQMLTAALSYLLPVVLRGGPRVTRAMNYELDRGLGWRLVVLNLGVLLFSLPLPSLISVAGSLLGLAGIGSFVPLAARAILVSRAGREQQAPDPGNGPRPVGSAVAGLVAVLLAVSAAVAVDPAALGNATSAAGAAQATGHTTEVTVIAENMSFSPSRIEVPAGDRLVLDVRNQDETQVHDLVLDTGHSSGRLAPGESTKMDIGVVGQDIAGWCSVIGHRQMGMTLQITVSGSTPGAGDAAHGSHDGAQAAAPADDPAADHIDLSLPPSAGFVPVDPTLPPAAGSTTHKVTMNVEELVTEVAPGVSQQLWTFNGSVPGPTLRGKIGDVFEVTLVNNGAMGHSVDFHAGDVSPDDKMRTIAPGESLVYTFTAKRSGIWLYHCATMPMSAHIASGMFGAVVIDPPDLPPVDHELLLVQSEYYLGQQGGPTDPRGIATMNPDLVAFNGYANQYDAAPIEVKVGERVRIWLLTAGPNLGISFHVVGGQFDTVYKEGAYLLQPGAGGAQSLDLAVAQGGFVELAFSEPGSYAIVNHVMTLAERGAHGHFLVTA